MRSTIYLDHYPDAILRGQEAVTADLTMSIGDMSAPATRTGAFVSDVLGSLGIQQLEPPRPSDMLLVGSSEGIARHQKRLTCAIGRIADKAMTVETQWDSPSLSRLENWGYEIATQAVPGVIRDKSPFISSIGHILRVIGNDLNDDGCDYARGLRPGWFHHASERQECFRTLGDTFTSLMARVPEHARRRDDDVTHYELTLLYRVGEWLWTNADRWQSTVPEARLVEEFDTMVDRERTAIAKAVATLHQRGLPEQFYLAPDTWERVLAPYLVPHEKRRVTPNP
jgi:hypothetical protein